MKLDTLIRFEGETEKAFNFYKSVFGGEFAALMRWKDMPGGAEGPDVSDADGEKIMHISLPIGGNTLMGCDVVGSMGHRLTAGDNFQMSITVESREKADTCFEALAQGGQIIMPMGDVFWGSYFGMVTDRFGIQWMISFAEHPED